VQGNGDTAFTDATQGDINLAIALDDQPPTTFEHFSDGGPEVRTFPATGEVQLPSAPFSGLQDSLDDFGEVGIGARTIVQFHDQVLIFEMPMDGPLTGIDPWILLHSGPDNEPTPRILPQNAAGLGPGDFTTPVERDAGLGIAPGSAVCSFGEGGVTINSDGQLLFAEFMFQDSTLEFGENGCDEVVNFPQIDVQ